MIICELHEGHLMIYIFFFNELVCSKWAVDIVARELFSCYFVYFDREETTQGEPPVVNVLRVINNECLAAFRRKKPFAIVVLPLKTNKYQPLAELAQHVSHQWFHYSK